MSNRIDGDEYWVSDEERAFFAEYGYVHLRGLLTDHEVGELEATYTLFLRREIEVPGKDYCDMAGDYGRDPEDFSIINVMLPRRYYPAWQGNIYERRAASAARQLCGDGMAIDYDQILAKQPYKEDAVFAWHQDMAYWPDTPDTPHGHVLAGHRRLHHRQRLHALRACHQPGGDAAAPYPPIWRPGPSPTPWAPTCERATSRFPVPISRGDVTVQHRAGHARLGRQLHRRVPPGLRHRLPCRGNRGHRAPARLHPQPQRQRRRARPSRRRRPNPLIRDSLPQTG